MATLAEVGEAVAVIHGTGAPLVLLHCVSSYPTPTAQANLRAIDTLRSTFGVPVGYSDHCLGLDASLAAVARDACLLERHVTLDRGRPGPDHAISLEPAGGSSTGVPTGPVLFTGKLVESLPGSPS